jgi:hypothetical protein
MIIKTIVQTEEALSKPTHLPRAITKTRLASQRLHTVQQTRPTGSGTTAAVTKRRTFARRLAARTTPTICANLQLGCR